jgi:predicted enzyme related to lactoylglutathione lyase
MAKVTGPESHDAHHPTDGLDGWITHTDLVSRDPLATRAWCETVFGWKFRPPMQTPNGEYHLFAYSSTGGGGIGLGEPPEKPGSTPFVHVVNAQAAFDRAVREGAAPVSKPDAVMPGVTIAMVRAPGGVFIGLSGP